MSNIGAIGGKFGSPLINVPEVAIIAMGRIQTLPQFDEDGNVYPASIMAVSIPESLTTMLCPYTKRTTCGNFYTTIVFGVNTLCFHQVNIGADHRVLDGATVAKFCNEWKLFIEKPELLMLYTR